MKSFILFLFFISCTCLVFSQVKSTDSSNAVKSSIIDVTSSLKIYPNPASNWLFVSHPTITKKGTQLIITDINGREVLKSEVRMHSIQSIVNINHLQAGVFFITWINGNERGVLKFQKY
jgi:hypothetical protein